MRFSWRSLLDKSQQEFNAGRLGMEITLCHDKQTCGYGVPPYIANGLSIL
jgi:hypothetical protein